MAIRGSYEADLRKGVTTALGEEEKLFMTISRVAPLGLGGGGGGAQCKK